MADGVEIMINTLPTWQAQHAASSLSHNDVVRLLGDANEEIERLQREVDKLRAALRPFADMAEWADSPMYVSGKFVAGLNTVEEYHNASRVLGEVTP